MIKFHCPNCKQKLGVPDEYASRRVRCSKCSQPATVPLTQPKPVPQPVVPENMTTQDDCALNVSDELQLQEPDPDPVSANSNLESQSSQSQFEGEDNFVRTNLAGIPIREQAIMEAPGNNILKVIISAVVIIAILIAGLLFVYNGPNDHIPQEIGTFAEDFITTLTENNIEAAKELLSPRKTISDAQINELVQRMADIEILNITSRCLYGISNEETSGYIYSCEVETDRGNLSFLLSILEQSQTITLVNATETNETARHAPPFNYYLFAMTPELNKIVHGGTEIIVADLWNTGRGLLLYRIAMLITLASIWIILGEEGEFNMWAVIITPYTFYLLARLSNKPGWLGVVAGIAVLIPFVGGLVFVPFFIIISIGVAQQYGKGILFGIGLGLLPFIFYPLLLITKPAFD